MKLRNKIRSHSGRSKKAAILLLCVFVMGLMSLAVADASFGAVIEGYKFYDRNGNKVFDAGEDVFAGDDIYIREVETGTPFSFKTEADGHYRSDNLSEGNYEVWSPLRPGWTQTTPKMTASPSDRYVMSIGQNETKRIDFGISDRVAPPPPPPLACARAATVKSVKSGDWNDPTVWDPEGRPGPGDWVWIETGHTVTVSETIDLGDGGLCNKGTIRAKDNPNANTAPSVKIIALSVHNAGIIGRANEDDTAMNGTGGNCYKPAKSGGSVEIFTTLFMNSEAGIIRTGHGGDSLGGCSQWVCPAIAGDGGKIEIFSTSAVNRGLMQSGNGGEANGCHARVLGGDGGVIRIYADVLDPNSQSENTGRIDTGRGGDATGPTGSTSGGKGGDADIQINNLGGIVIGKEGGFTPNDPINLKASDDLHMEGSDIVTFYTDEGGTIDFTQLKEGAISANKVIQIYTKAQNGEGGSLDLRGVSGKVFKAGEKVEVFADTILTDDGVTLNDLADAPIVEVFPGKILYRVALSVEKRIVGNPGEKISLPVKVINGGPKIDEYALSVSNSAGWKLGTLPYTVTIGGIYYKMLNLDITIPEDAEPGMMNEIMITATSLKDFNVTATEEIIVFVNHTDSDNDEMPDVWETEYGLDPFVNDAAEDLDGDGYSNIQEYNAGTNPNDPDSKPEDETPNSNFKSGVFTVGDTGVIQVDWLYDGGAYKGELGIFSLEGMKDLTPGSAEFIAEAVRRVLSDSTEGHLVLSDPTEGARFSGTLGKEPQDWNSGEYKGVKSFEMNPGDWFATILVPNSTFSALASNPGTTNSNRRPLFSLVSSNPAYGMYLGQIADVNGMGTAFSYEDMNAANSDRDYNDLIIQITGADIDECLMLDDLNVWEASRSRSSRRDSSFFDWRVQTELGQTIMEHLDAQILESDTLWMSAELDGFAKLVAFDPDNRSIGEIGGHIPGATFGTDVNGNRFVSLPAMEEGDYRLVIRSAEDETALLRVKKHQGNAVLSEESEEVEIKAHGVLVSDISVFSSGDGLDIGIGGAAESPAGSYDFNGDGIIDDADIHRPYAVWNTCEGDADYDPFYDLDGDGCISIMDIMPVVNGKSAN